MNNRVLISVTAKSLIIQITALLGLILLPITVRAQTQSVYWYRRAYGQVFVNCNGDQYWPDNNYWQQAPHYGEYCGQTYEDQPGNWSDGNGDEFQGYPDGDYNVFISNAGLFPGDENFPRIRGGFGYGGPFTVTSLTIQNTGYLAIGGLFSNTLNVNSSATVETGGTLHIYDGDQLTADSLTLQSGAALIMDGSGGAGSGILIVQSFVTEGDGAETSAGGGSTIQINSGGSLTKSAGSGIYSFDVNNFLSLQSGGTVTCDSGTLALPFASYAGGINFNAAAGAIIDLVPATLASTSQDSLGGQDNGGTVRLSAGTLYGGPSGTLGTILDFPGNVFQWTGGTIDPGYTGVTNEGTIAIAGDVTGPGDGFTNSGVINHNSGTFTIPNGNFNNDNVGTYNITGAAAIVGSGSSFLNAGTIIKSGSGTATFSNINFNNYGGTVEADDGTLQLSGIGGSSGGIYNAESGGVLDLVVSGQTYYCAGTFTGSGDGIVRLSAGTLTVSDPANTPVTFNFPDDLFQWTGGAINPNTGTNDPSTGFFNIGTITIAGDVTDDNWAFWNRGIIDHISGSLTVASGGFNNDTAGTYNVMGDVRVDGTFYNLGTMTVGLLAPGQIDFEGPLNLGSDSNLAFGISGTTPDSEYGVLNQSSQSLTLAGTLTVTLINGFAPQPTDTFSIITTVSPLAGSFTNVPSGGRLTTADGAGSFLVTYSSDTGDATALDNVILSDYQAALPSVTVTASPTRVREGSDATYKIILSQAAAGKLAIHISMSGTATLGSDYTLTGAQLQGTQGRVLIPAGQTSATVTLHALTDGVQEGTETAILQVVKSKGYTVAAPQKATIRIFDSL